MQMNSVYYAVSTHKKMCEERNKVQGFIEQLLLIIERMKIRNSNPVLLLSENTEMSMEYFCLCGISGCETALTMRGV